MNTTEGSEPYLKLSVQDKLEAIMQSAEEIESASDATLDCCGFQNEDERLAFIKAHAADIVRRSAILLGYVKDGDSDAGSVESEG